ncbi:hypothetical protein DOTSEDRAFT_56430 [Dothistroma septosporum NZE10]|uniref:RecF/RecN/SMC N-terminal domain-containing protein n=1 Tax=Dothistroma septosporum (strain NZE10 / CBS 128990) TaxID=675120 RepID=N1PCG4_DOTSN|nr:hypothetical protein DOTSEDRAFT_56430 [Dothistroma septosporum NZE10]
MAPMGKRRRDSSDEDEIGIEIESASSSFRQNQHKRTKVALARASGASMASNDFDGLPDSDHYNDLLEDSAGEEHGHGIVEVDANTEHSLFNQDSDLEQPEDDVDEFAATQIVRKAYNTHRDNRAEECGIIDEISCRNFMCHSKLTITLGPLINFIIGHNGSGKSAILTALTMCLGGKTKATNRGTSLKGLIKEGTESATLCVTIRNQGENAYKKELYGKVVKVERHFSRSGTSGFKIKNENDKTVTTKKADLDDILDYFCLQLDNPIAVLSQDNARAFLSNSTPADKYKFFLKGSGLETLNADYALFEEHIDSMESKLRTRTGDIEILKKAADDAEERKRRGDQQNALGLKRRKAVREYAWCQVEEEERKLVECEDAVRGSEETVTKAQNDATVAGNALEAHEVQRDAAERAKEAVEAQLGPATEKLELERGKFEKNKKELLDQKAEQRIIKDTLKKAKADKVSLATQIEEETARLEAASGDAHVQRVQELEELKQAFEAAKRKFNEHDSTHQEIKNTLASAENNMKTTQNAKRAAEQEVSKLQTRLDNLKREESNVYGPYHPRTAQLIREIDRETRWRKKPIGPMGVHVRNTKPEWGSVIERTLGGVLNAYCVTCKDDQTFLNKIAERLRMDVVSYIGDPAPLDSSGKEPATEVDTIMRVLRIDDDQVRNTLILNHGIDQTVLIKDGQRVQDWIKETGGRPRNVKAVIAMARERGAGIRYDWSRSGTQKSSAVKAWEGSLRMKTDRQEQLRLSQGAVDDAKRVADSASQRHRSTQEEVKSAQQAVHKHKRDATSLRAEMQKAEDAVDEKANEIDNNRPQDGKLQQLQRQLEEAGHEHDTAQGSYSDSVEQVDKLDGKARELKDNLDVAQVELDHVNTLVEQADVKLKRREAQREESLHKKNAAYDDLETARAHLAARVKKRDDQRAVVEDYTEQASAVSERVEPEAGVTHQMYEARIDKLEKEIMAMERRAGGTLEELTRDWNEKQLAYMNAKNQLDDLNGVRKALKETLKERHRRWGLFRKYISLRARLNFQYLLSERSFRGRMLLNHNDKLLDISVEPDSTRASDSGRQAKTLSGGEKSFSTICLLLSIWEAMGSPIRCLDEFDVFMDSVNRAQSMELMIHTARRAVGRQFILITPQSMNNVKMGTDVTVIKMSDPERGQGTLNFNGREM